ncbi:hypothetical protein GCM10022268_28520 [Sphingomonas cynarae]|uniref:Tetratricopeptide repeat protein n=1 Tax=Sphingomonas cynarae TaxID=930197 RepID=A0ABP7EKQ0_9SPHN
MNPHSRRLIVQRLTIAIGAIGPEFEAFGGTFLDFVLTTPLDHSGINSGDLPISRVLDSTSDDGTIVAQYSAEGGYFTKGMPKALGDIDKTLKRRPGVKRILLLANEPRKPIIADNFKRDMLKRPDMNGRQLGILGSDQIARVIVRKLLFNDAALEALAIYLPDLADIRDQAARDRLFPGPSQGHRPRADIDAEIARRLALSPCLLVSGIGGSGKSAAAAAYGEGPSGYDLTIWLDGDEFKNAAGLLATPLVRGGDKRNIASMLRSGRCLLVIDDPATPIVPSELAALCGAGSHVIVTTRDRQADDYLLPDLAMGEARALLDTAPAPACPDDVFATIWITVGGHPLSLALMNAAVRAGAPWTDIALDCDAVGQLSDSTQPLADRLLARYRTVLTDALSVFEWIGQPECDIGFLRYAIKPAGIRNLRDRALTAADLPSAVRLHDVIFASLSSLAWWTDYRRAALTTMLAAYLETAAAANDLSLWAASMSFRERLRSLVDAGDRRPAFLLALLNVTQPDASASILPDDPVKSAAAHVASERPISSIDFSLLIESFEWLYRQKKAVSGDEAQIYAEAGLALFDHLETLVGLTPRQRSEIGHHRGKALQWLQRHAEARVVFEAVMSSDHPLWATGVQLIRSYKVERAYPEATTLGLSIVEAAEGGEHVSPSVLLATIQDMPWQIEATRKAVLWPRSDFIERTIINLAKAGYVQAYKTLASVARFWSAEAPELLARVLSTIPLPDSDQIEDDEVRTSLADLLLEFSLTQAGADAAHTRETALSLFEAARNPKAFHTQRKAELLITMGRPAIAEPVLRGLPHSCWVDRLLARALLDQGEPRKALVLIDAALADPKGESRFHEFHELRHGIRMALDDPNAIDSLKEAVRLSPEGAQRERLVSKLSIFLPN